MLSGQLHAGPLYPRGKLLHYLLNLTVDELKGQSWMLFTARALSLYNKFYNFELKGPLKKTHCILSTNISQLMLYEKLLA